MVLLSLPGTTPHVPGAGVKLVQSTVIVALRLPGVSPCPLPESTQTPAPSLLFLHHPLPVPPPLPSSVSLHPLLFPFPRLHLCPVPSSSIQPTCPQGGGTDHPSTQGHGVLLSTLLQRCEPECEDAPITYIDRAQIWELGVSNCGGGRAQRAGHALQEASTARAAGSGIRAWEEAHSPGQLG